MFIIIHQQNAWQKVIFYQNIATVYCIIYYVSCVEHVITEEVE